jgi:membrane dipeptidase
MGYMSGPTDDDLLARAKDVLDAHPLVDGHNDLAWELRIRAGYDLDLLDVSQPQPDLQTDLPRLRAGGVGTQFWSVYVPSTLSGEAAVIATLEQIDAVHALVRRYPDDLHLASTAVEVEQINDGGRIACLLGAEGGHSIGGSLGVLRMLHVLGVRYLTLTHNDNTEWADSATDVPRLGGLSADGEEVVRECNRLGVLVDLSHVAPDTMRAALRVTEAPVVFSHSCARALVDSPRNVPDDVLAALRDNGGVCMVAFVPPFVDARCADWLAEMRAVERRLEADLSPEEATRRIAEWTDEHPMPPSPPLTAVADHIEHVRDVAGLDHVGIGGDYDGFTSFPPGLEDVSGYPALVAELLRRGWDEDGLRRLIRDNALRVLRDAEEAAGSLQAERPHPPARRAVGA